MGKKENICWKKIRYVPVVTAVIIFVLINIFFFKNGFDIEEILNYTPGNQALAVIFMLLIFGLKSISVVFPLDVLYMADGILFSPLEAIIVSIAGVCVSLTIPYISGKVFGENIMREIYEKYPKAEVLARYQNENPFFASFITRIVGILPLDVVSAYFGAHNLAFGEYVAGSISGLMLSLIATTLLGNRLSNPFSLEFLMVILLKIAVSAVSICIKYNFDKKKEYL